MMTIFQNQNLHHNFTTFGVKYETLMGNSSAVQQMIFNISNVSTQNIISEIKKNHFLITLTLTTNYFSIFHFPLDITRFTSLGGHIITCTINSCTYHKFISKIPIDHCNNLHGE